MNAQDYNHAFDKDHPMHGYVSKLANSENWSVTNHAGINSTIRDEFSTHLRDEKPLFPLSRVQNESHSLAHSCLSCGSTSHRVGFMGLFGERVCDNDECESSMRRFK